VRASDVEREDALQALAAHFADGRIDRSEFDERADAALAARTRSQLQALFTDLPDQRPEPAAPPKSDPARASGGLRQAWRGAVANPGFPVLVLAPALLFFAVAVTAAAHGLPPFPLIPLLFIFGRRHRRRNREARPWI
jgi:hypothetical protein